jgi:acyl-CoA synthetase (AMP-forming)/AMP-acid ligase II
LSRQKITGNTDCIDNWLPLYHDMGLIACFMLPMVCHLRVVMQSPLRLERMQERWLVHSVAR